MSIEDSVIFKRIDDRLTTSGLVNAEQLSELHREGYDAVINLMPDSESPIPDEARIVHEQGLDYVYIPVDFNEPTSADLEAFTEAMDARAGSKVHVHCAANYRVTAFYSLYALKRGLCTRDEADDFVHSVWNPAEFPAWATFVTNEQARAD
jgi:uncharacterized protein (TIGR01244 family)